MHKSLFSRFLKLKKKSANCLALYPAILGLFFGSGCGRRPKRLLGTEILSKKKKANHLSFTPIDQFAITATTDNKPLLSWEKYKDDPHSEFIGYNIYRFISNSFVPGHPLNKRPIANTSYIDKRHAPKKSWCYLVRAVLIKDNQVIETPASKIIHYEH